MHELKYLWHSKRYDSQRSLYANDMKPIFFQKEDGEVIRVSFVSTTPEHQTAWDDAEFLGMGTFHHIGE